MNRFCRKVTTPQVMPSGTGYTVSMKSSKKIGTLLLMKMPTRMQEVYRMAAQKKQSKKGKDNIELKFSKLHSTQIKANGGVFFSGKGYWSEAVTAVFWLHQVMTVIK